MTDPVTIELIDLAQALDEQATRERPAKAQRLRVRATGLALRVLKEPTPVIQEAMLKAWGSGEDVRRDRVVADEMYVISDLLKCASTRAAVWKEIGE